jgi:hypothetical protein
VVRLKLNTTDLLHPCHGAQDTLEILCKSFNECHLDYSGLVFGCWYRSLDVTRTEISLLSPSTSVREFHVMASAQKP